MNGLKLLNIIRILTAVIIGIIFGHQAETTIKTVGVNEYSIGYLAAQLIFYLVLYLIRFFVTIKNRTHWLAKDKIISRIRISFLILAVIMTLLEAKVNILTLSPEDTVRLLLKVIFVFLPEVIFFFMEVIYHYFKDDDHNEL